MKLKFNFSGTVKAALDLARQEPGPGAVLVHSRRAMPEARQRGEYEVVFALIPAAETASPALDGWFAALVCSGLDVQAIEEAMRRLMESHGSAEMVDRAWLRSWLADGLAGRMRVGASRGRSSKGRRVVVLAGPPGSGKTSLLVRLAVTQGRRGHQPTLLVSLDNLRVGEAGQLRSYATILGVGFESLKRAPGLPQTLSEHRNRDLVLMDTPGYGPKEMEETAELAPSMASVADMDIHLVITAAMNPADRTRAVGRFEVFRPSKLVFTHRDETESYGTIWNEAARTGKALSFLATGQPVPEDLEAATRDRILNLVLGPPDERVRAAA
jgi:flagellar biosynthesis protein FlhF